MSDLDRLAALMRAATPAPWIRRWQSTVVNWMGGDGALTSMQDIDLAVALVNAAPELIAGARAQAALEQADRWIIREGATGRPQVDHGCAQCVPGGPMVDPAFICALHAALERERARHPEVG